MSAGPRPTTVRFTIAGGYSWTAISALRRHQERDAARMPELQRGVGVLREEDLLDGHRFGRMRRDDATERLVNVAEPRGPAELLGHRRSCPLRSARSRVPSSCTTPQPVRRLPGSMPRTRMAAQAISASACSLSSKSEKTFWMSSWSSSAS